MLQPDVPLGGLWLVVVPDAVAQRLRETPRAAQKRPGVVMGTPEQQVFQQKRLLEVEVLPREHSGIPGAFDVQQPQPAQVMQ